MNNAQKVDKAIEALLDALEDYEEEAIAQEKDLIASVPKATSVRGDNTKKIITLRGSHPIFRRHANFHRSLCRRASLARYFGPASSSFRFGQDDE